MPIKTFKVFDKTSGDKIHECDCEMGVITKANEVGPETVRIEEYHDGELFQEINLA